jgi:hypothetical protein
MVKALINGDLGRYEYFSNRRFVLAGSGRQMVYDRLSQKLQAQVLTCFEQIRIT